MTYGQIRFRCTKLVPGIDPDLIDGWIEDRYTQILDRVKWQRLEVRAAIQTAAPYTTGTMTLTAGLPAIAGVGTAWIASMDGMGLRIGDGSEFYVFNFQGATVGVLDRAFEGETGSYSYELYQSVYPLPDDCKILTSVSDLQGLPLSFVDRNRSNSRAVAYGSPIEWRWLMDDTSDPPRMQIEVYPTPDRVTSLGIEYTAEEGEFGRTAGTTLLPWITPGCLVAGVHADMLAHVKDFAGSDRKEARFAMLITDLQRTNTANMRPMQLRLAANFKRRPARTSIDRTRLMP